MDAQTKCFDVVIIGAGISGLSAGSYFASKSINYLIVEGQNRVGGRTYSKSILDDKFVIDLGGQWIGPKQKRILNLIQQYQINLIEQTWFHHYPNQLGRSIGFEPLNSFQLDEFNLINNQWDQMALEFESVQSAFSYSKSSQWAQISVETFLNEHPSNLDFRVKQELKLEILTLTGCDAEDLSLLYWLILIRSIPDGLKSLEDGCDGAQHFKIEGGTENLLSKISLNLNIHLNDPLKTINYQSAEKITLILQSNLRIHCQRLILAFAPTLLSNIEFIPEIQRNFQASVFMGKAIKTIFVYSNKCWTDNQINQYDKRGPCSNIFESTKPFALIGLILGNDAVYWANEDQSILIETINQQYSSLFNIDRKPIETFIFDWTKQTFSKGCYAAVYRPSSLSNWIEKDETFSDKRIYLSSTEMAFEWIGYLEGAIEVSQRISQRIFDSLETHQI